MPTWMALKGIPTSSLEVAREITKRLGELVGLDRRNNSIAKQQFCVALESRGGWITQLAVMNESNNKQSIILVDYCNLPICCRYSVATDHLVKDCPELKGSPMEANTSEGDQPEQSTTGKDGNSKASKEAIGLAKGINKKARTDSTRSKTKLDLHSTNSQTSKSKNHQHGVEIHTRIRMERVEESC